MVTRDVLSVLLICIVSCTAISQASIAPNYSAYTLNPEYKANPTLGWAQQRIEEKLGRGMIAVPMGQGRVYVGWRLPKNRPPRHLFQCLPLYHWW
jgi:hypothetical protein